MSKPALFLLCALLSASCATVKGQNYAKTIFYGDVELRGTPGVSNFTATLTSGSLVGTYYYRLSGTNLAGRIPSTAATNLTCATNGVLLQWKRRDGLFAYVVERSRDGSTWTNWSTVRPDATSFTDKGTSTWAGTVFTSVYAAVASPTAIGFPFLSTSSPDGVTMIYSNGILSSVAPAAPDLIARAAITTHTNAAISTAHTGVLTYAQLPALVLTNAAAFDAAGSAAAVSNAAFGQGWVTASVTNGLASTNWVASQGYVTGAVLRVETQTLANVTALGRTAYATGEGDYQSPRDFAEGILDLYGGASIPGIRFDHVPGASTNYGWLYYYSGNVWFDTTLDSAAYRLLTTKDSASFATSAQGAKADNAAVASVVLTQVWSAAQYPLAITQLTASAISAAGGVTGTVVRVETDPLWSAASNGVLYAAGGASGTNTTGSIFVNGKATTIGTNTPWTAQGYLTNDSYTAGTDLSSALVGTTCTITRAHGQSCYLVLTTNTTFTVDSSYPTNGAGTFELSTQLGGFSATFLAGTMTNTQASLSTGTTWNATIFHRGYRQTLWTGR